ncbi:hypothetical protein JOD57_001472 [Geodermatophilus bullaregiensis]|uniref:hypothetical protein n=1 Tax=Geodermatophilus bullaregiensis TaxID=1564160 RepID=UPI00195B602B|nr:hypothetical protein [Geodermatophilus bullaregiensis]MBM7805635.1 hypothetical protein [Geodermatophilus bullaregiensis]
MGRLVDRRQWRRHCFRCGVGQSRGYSPDHEQPIDVRADSGCRAKQCHNDTADGFTTARILSTGK